MNVRSINSSLQPRRTSPGDGAVIDLEPIRIEAADIALDRAGEMELSVGQRRPTSMRANFVAASVAVEVLAEYDPESLNGSSDRRAGPAQGLNVFVYKDNTGHLRALDWCATVDTQVER